jgi:hypothetical protein
MYIIINSRNEYLIQQGMFTTIKRAASTFRFYNDAKEYIESVGEVYKLSGLKIKVK